MCSNITLYVQMRKLVVWIFVGDALPIQGSVSALPCVPWRHRVLCPALYHCYSALWTSTLVCVSENFGCNHIITVLINKKITVEWSEWIRLSLVLSQKLDVQAKGEAYWHLSLRSRLEMCCLMFLCQPSTVWPLVTRMTVRAAVYIQCWLCARLSSQPRGSQP